MPNSLDLRDFCVLTPVPVPALVAPRNPEWNEEKEFMLRTRVLRQRNGVERELGLIGVEGFVLVPEQGGFGLGLPLEQPVCALGTDSLYVELLDSKQLLDVIGCQVRHALEQLAASRDTSARTGLVPLNGEPSRPITWSSLHARQTKGFDGRMEGSGGDGARAD